LALNGSEPGQKKSAGIGSLLNEVKLSSPPAVAHRSTPLSITSSPASAGSAARAKQATPHTTTRREILDILIARPPWRGRAAPALGAPDRAA
jgi:hypothetical protein